MNLKKGDRVLDLEQNTPGTVQEVNPELINVLLDHEIPQYRETVYRTVDQLQMLTEAPQKKQVSKPAEKTPAPQKKQVPAAKATKKNATKKK